MIWRHSLMGLGLLAVLAGCQGTEMAGEQTATTAVATGVGIGPSAGDGFDEVVGAGLVGGADGELGGRMMEVDEFRDPRFGRSGLRRNW